MVLRSKNIYGPYEFRKVCEQKDTIVNGPHQGAYVDTPEGEDIPEETVPKGPGLPQTGVLWWPVPILACCGMGLFVIGWARRRQDGAGNE